MYVDCYPRKGERPTEFSEILSAVQDLVHKEHGVPHYKLVPNMYGGTGAILQAGLAEVLAAVKPTAVHVTRSSAEALDAMSVLEELASQVVA